MNGSPVKEWKLNDLAKETGVPERTIRFYISRKLVPPPHRVGPGATYGEEHKARILKIRELQKGHPEQGRPGLMLAEIELLLAAEEAIAPTASQDVPPMEQHLIGYRLDQLKAGTGPEQSSPRAMAWFEQDGSVDRNQIRLFDAKRDTTPAAPLPEPEIWRSYQVADDVRVMFKTGASPWRTKLLLGALRWFAAAVKNSNAKEDKGE
jgi:DNA-binding transcriptional MerR regulator